MMALELLDELAEWGLHPPLLTADAGYGHVSAAQTLHDLARPKGFEP
ncbi:transposase [Salinispora arenicola]